MFFPFLPTNSREVTGLRSPESCCVVGVNRPLGQIYRKAQRAMPPGLLALLLHARQVPQMPLFHASRYLPAPYDPLLRQLP